MGVGKLMPFSPTEWAHFSSAMAASMSHIGRCMRPMWRSGSIEQTSASHWLYMCWPALSRSKSCSMFAARMRRVSVWNGTGSPFWLSWNTTSAATPSRLKSSSRAAMS